MKAHHTLAIIALATLSVGHAQTGSPMAPMAPMPGRGVAVPAPAAMSHAEVLKVLPKAVLLKHGPIDSMGMGAMTMQFGVADAKQLKSIRKGDKVRFAVARVGGQVVVTRIEKTK